MKNNNEQYVDGNFALLLYMVWNRLFSIMGVCHCENRRVQTPETCRIYVSKHLHVASVLGRIDVGLKKLTRDVLGPRKRAWNENLREWKACERF